MSVCSDGRRRAARRASNPTSRRRQRVTVCANSPCNRQVSRDGQRCIVNSRDANKDANAFFAEVSAQLTANDLDFSKYMFPHDSEAAAWI